MSNVAVVVLDSLRADRFSEHFEWLPGTWFTNAYSTSHWTIPAHASIYTGRYPREINTHAKSLSLNCESNTLAELMQENGYTTHLFTTNLNIYKWDGWRRGFHQCFSPTSIDPRYAEAFDWHSFMDETESGLNRYLRGLWASFTDDVATLSSLVSGFKIACGKYDGNEASAVLRRIKDTDFGESEFLVINLMEMHSPYDPPSPYNVIDEPVDVVIGDAFGDLIENHEQIINSYNASALYLSDFYRKIFTELRDDFDYIITLSDHGEMLGEHEMWNHGYGLYPELVHVPLVVSGADVTNEYQDAVVSLLDIYETVTSIAGIETDSHGHNLLENISTRDVLFEYHGFLPSHWNQFKNRDISRQVFDDRDQPLDGMVTEDGTIIYETHENDLTVLGDLDEATAKTRLNQLIKTTDRNAIVSDKSDATKDVMKQLEKLGYA